MNNMCRFCLSDSSEAMSTLYEDCDILLKMSTLSIQITINSTLPNQTCLTCIDKLQEMYEFREKILDNENKLKQLITRQELNSKNVSNADTNSCTLVQDNKENEIVNNISDNLHDMNSDNDVLKAEYNSDMEEVSYNCKENSALETTNSIVAGSENFEVNYTSGVDNKKFKCLMCFELLDSQIDLLKHYKQNHQETECDVNISNYFCTETSQDGCAIYKCVKCNKEYKNTRAIKRHVQSHTESRPYICKICGRMYKTVSEIVRHDRAHSSSSLMCSYHCGYATAYYGALKEHEKRHRTEFKYTCEVCGKGFQVKTWYEQHQNMHNGLKPFVCDVCGLAFHMSRYLTSHRSTVHPQTSNVKRYICVHCSLPCDSKRALTKHLKEHGIVKSFLCEICGKTLSNAERLKFHKRMHLGVKPFHCSTCNKSFTKKFNLQIHERTHTGEKLYGCGKCGKRYSQRSALIRHNLRHHKERLG